MIFSTLPTRLLFGALLLAGCSDAPTFVPGGAAGGPRGAITGSIVFTGPAPCTRNGTVIGAAIVFAFHEDALPPPEGLATEPAGIAVVTGDQLFRGSSLEFSSSGAALCPSPTASFVSTSSPFALAPLEAGTYQLRGFFDRDGDFNPAFSLFNLPTRGDVAGGAVENPVDALAGAIPHYRSIALGAPSADGTLAIPETGARIDGVSVNLGLSLPNERPMFHVGGVLEGAKGNGELQAIVVPSDYELNSFDTNDPTGTEASLIRLTLAAGFPASEAAAGKAMPYSLPLNDASFTITREDANRDGKRDAADHVPESTVIPSLAPLALMTRLADGSSLVTATPVVFMQGLTLLDSLTATALSKPDLATKRASLVIALRPAAICIDPHHPERPATLLVSHETDGNGKPLIPDPEGTLATLAKRLGRKVELAYGCLRQGNYAMNLVYETGQAWTVPNEAGTCATSEAPSADGLRCGGRARLASQAQMLQVGAPRDPAYCAAHPTPPACAE